MVDREYDLMTHDHQQYGVMSVDEMPISPIYWLLIFDPEAR